MTKHFSSVRIVIAAKLFPPDGAASAIRMGFLAKTLTDRGYDVVVLTTTPKGSYKSDRKIQRFPSLRSKDGSIRGYLQYLSFDIPLFFRLLFRKYDLLLLEPPPSTGYVGRIVSFLKRKPYFWFASDVSTVAAKGIGVPKAVQFIVRWLETATIKSAAKILSVSSATTKSMISLGASPDTVVEVGTGVDTDVFTPDLTVEKAPYPTFIYAGTMSEIHGARVFIEAFLEILKKYPTSQLLMVGQGVEVEAMEREVLGFESNIRFIKTVPPPKARELMLSSWVGLASVKPGSGYEKAFATKGLAYLSAGLPIIYAGAGPLGSLVESEKLGWAVNWDKNDVATAMESAIKSTEYVGRSEEARLHSWVEENFSLRSVCNISADVITSYFCS